MTEWSFVKDVTVDARRRISLGKAGKFDHKRYRLTERSDGSILLQPVISVLAVSENTHH